MCVFCRETADIGSDEGAGENEEYVWVLDREVKTGPAGVVIDLRGCGRERTRATADCLAATGPGESRLNERERGKVGQEDDAGVLRVYTSRP